MVSILALLLTNQPVELERLAQFLSQAKSLSVTFKAQVSGSDSSATGHLSFQRPNRMKFKAMWLGSTYVFAVGARRTVEYESSLRRYAEFAPSDSIVPPLSRVSGTSDFLFPFVLLSTSMVHLQPKRFNYVKEGMSAVGAKQATLIVGKDGGERFELWIDSVGKLLKYSGPQDTGDGPKRVTFTFSDYQVNQKIPDSQFNVSVPSGYDPVGTAQELYPLNVGNPFPSTWRDVVSKSTARAWSTTGKSLVVVSAPEDPVSEKMAPMLKGLLVRPTIITTDPNGELNASLSTFRTLFDPTGQAMDRLRLPGTPMVYVIDSRGIITKIWFGFDPANEKELASEINAALKKR